MWQVRLLSRDAQESPLTREQQVGKGGVGVEFPFYVGRARPTHTSAATGNQDGTKGVRGHVTS